MINLMLQSPLLVTALAIIVSLKSMRISYPTYFSGVRMIHLLLRPATVAHCGRLEFKQGFFNQLYSSL